MSDRFVTLISPARRRLVHLDRMNPEHATTMLNLATLGWGVYTGPASTDSTGFIIAGTDPNLAPPIAVIDDYARPIGSGALP